VIILDNSRNTGTKYIQRLIGLPVDKIEIKNDLVYINASSIDRVEVGEHVLEEDIDYIKFCETVPNNVSYFSYKMKNQPMSNYGPKIVKKGKYFFLEIIRDNSNDSR
jgi:signal peptidase I